MPVPIIASDMDGTLSTAETWRGVHAWILAHHPSRAARRFVATQLPLIALARTGLFDRERFRARWLRNHARLLRGASATELRGMGEWVVEQHLWPARRQPAIDALIEAAREARDREPAVHVILASGAYQPIVDAFAARLDADLALGTPLETRDGVATGGLATEVQAGNPKAAAVQAYAAGARLLVAFGDTAADIPLLELAQRPVAVAPDAVLRRVAIERGWEILEGP
jgi:HAD superfamily phosphoserine phosphatase-like hydrolase